MPKYKHVWDKIMPLPSAEKPAQVLWEKAREESYVQSIEGTTGQVPYHNLVRQRPQGRGT